LDYLDIELRLTRGQRGHQVKISGTQAGEASAPFKIQPSDPWIVERLTALEGRRVAMPRSGKAKASGPVPLDTASAKLAKEIGEHLFSVLMADQGVYACYKTGLLRAQEQKKGLRLRLRIEEPELAVIPWEYLFDPRLQHRHLCLGRETPIVRYLETEQPVPTLNLEPPIRVLGMVGYSAGLAVENEQRLLEASVEHLMANGTLDLKWVPARNWRALQKMLRAGPWHVFHFIGHGGFDEKTKEGFLVLEDEHGPRPRNLSAQDLGTILAEGHDAPRLVVLNSCEGARADASDIISSTGAILAAMGIPAVISMQYEITDDAAMEFSRTFYEALGEGRAIDEAVSESRMAIKLARDESVEWVTPVLHMRSREGRLWVMDLSSIVKPRPVEIQTVIAPPPPAGVNRITTASIAGLPREKGFHVLASRVKTNWIEGVLAPATTRGGRMNVDGEVDSRAVASPWEEIGSGSSTAESGAEARSVRDVFDELGWSLLILGEPGAGKTVALLQLVKDLLQSWEENPGPLAVVFNLSSWALRRDPLVDWLATELGAKYQIPRQIALSWLNGRHILPFLDGLDEVRADARAACVERINEFAAGPQMAGMVVCCRLKEYLDLPSRLTLNGAVRLRQLSREQVFSYLDAAGDQLAALRRLLERDSGLLIDARTPLMLSLMARAYGGMRPEDIDAGREDTLEERRKKVMKAYVERAFRQAGISG
jgi:hypothetical protein